MTTEPGFGVYIHWPFCASKCPYCDFNSHVRAGGIDEQRFLAAYLRELATFSALAPGREISSIFFGGGTPSLMDPRTIRAIIDAIAGHWTIRPDAEVTLEANPTSVESERFAGYRNAGINRVSLGVQALNDPDLRRLGRLHTVAEALAAVDIAKAHFDRVTFDLIYARPGQTVPAWRAELGRALELQAGHLSVYQLTIEAGTAFADLHGSGRLHLPEDHAAHDLYEVTQDMCEAAGLPAYEISNHARPGEESRHNLVYWQYGEYAGIGAGAHSRIRLGKNAVARVTERHPEKWAELVEIAGSGTVETEQLDARAQADEMLIMGLRLREGLNLPRLRAMTGFSPNARTIADLRSSGLLAPFQERHPERLAATRDGRFVLNTLVLQISQSLEPSDGVARIQEQE